MRKFTQLSSSNTPAPTIVLLHGFLASSQYWARLTPILRRQGYRVVTIDLLGFGSSRREPAEKYDYEEHVAHIHKKIATYNIPQPFTLIGHSMGALISARYANHYPQRVSKLFLLNPPIYKNRDEVRATLRDTNHFYRLMLDSSLRNLLWKVFQYLPLTQVAPHSHNARELSMRNVIEKAEFLEDVRKLRVPTTIVTGRYERTEYVKNIAGTIEVSQATLIIHDGTHHMPLLRPRDTARLILSGLQKDI